MKQTSANHQGRTVGLVWMLMVLAAMQAVSAERTGPVRFLRMNSGPGLVLGAYALPQDYTYEDGRKMGFNLLHVSADAAKWDRAREAGLFVWHSFGETMDFASGNVEEKKSRIRSVVEKNKDHPALLFWESMDEPAWTDKKPEEARATPEGLAQGYQFLKSLDPIHPVYMNHAPRNTVETLRQYNSACDIVCTDIYPIIPPGMKPQYAITPEGHHGDLPNQTPSCVGEYVDKMKQVASGGRPVFVVLQGFAWEALRPEAERDKSKVVYPTYAESRFMAYHAILHGANGLLYWGLSYVPPKHPFLNDLAKVLQEIQRLSPVITQGQRFEPPKMKYHERGSSITTGIEVLGKESAGQAYLFAANTSVYPAAADFLLSESSSLPPVLASAQELEVVGESRTVPISQGAFFDEFEGLGVHVYRTKWED